MINNEIIMKIKNIFNLQNINQLVGLMGFSIVLFIYCKYFGVTKYMDNAEIWLVCAI